MIVAVTAVALAARHHPDAVARWKHLTVHDVRVAVSHYMYHRWYLPNRSLVSRMRGWWQWQHSFFDCSCCCLQLGGQDLDVEYQVACQCSDRENLHCCKHCIAQYLDTQVLDGGKTKLLCLFRHCPLDDRLIRKRLSVTATRIYDRALILEAAAVLAATSPNKKNKPEKLWQCPATDCNCIGFVSQRHGPQPPYLWTRWFSDYDHRRIRCPTCHIASCHFCDTVWSRGVVSHDGATCQDYAARLAQTDNDQALLRQWKFAAQTQVCPSPHCHFTIEKNSGGNHVSCRCGHHFCWVCGEEWSQKHSYFCRKNNTNINNRVASSEDPTAAAADPTSWWTRWLA